MATYTELHDRSHAAALINRIAIAVAVEAEVIRTEANSVMNHQLRLDWAKESLNDPHSMAERMIWAMLAQNKDKTPVEIDASTDAELQAAVSAAVDILI